MRVPSCRRKLLMARFDGLLKPEGLRSLLSPVLILLSSCADCPFFKPVSPSLSPLRAATRLGLVQRLDETRRAARHWPARRVAGTGGGRGDRSIVRPAGLHHLSPAAAGAIMGITAKIKRTMFSMGKECRCQCDCVSSESPGATPDALRDTERHLHVIRAA